jgi:hypothetical protein
LSIRAETVWPKSETQGKAPPFATGGFAGQIGLTSCEGLVEVVSRHFHRHRSLRAARCGSSFWSGLRSHKVLVMREYGGHEDLRGSGHRSVIPYVHG